MNTKPCTIEGCEARIAPYNVLCPKHWWMASPGARRALTNLHDRTRGFENQSPDYERQLKVVIAEAKNKAAWERWARTPKKKGA